MAETERLARRIDELQDALYAEGRRALLVVLQGRDTSGKDGTIRKVFGPLNPQGLTVASFKAPSPIELAHDYLWRVHQAVPVRGTIGVFNRSHYEDVLVVRVHGLVPEAVWRPRYEQIMQFERMLTENGVTILKFFLHISRKEQRERLLARLEDPDEVLEVLGGRPGRARPVGRVHRGVPGGAGSGPARRRRPGTWCRRTRNTSATCWWRRWWRSGWSGWIRSTPARPRDLEEFRRALR